MSVFPERDKRGTYTGRWICDVQVKSQRFKATLPTMGEADDWEAHCKRHKAAPDKVGGLTFREVAERCIRAGGPRRKWHTGKDPAILARLRYVMGTKMGDTPIKAIGTEHVEALIADLRKRPVMVAGRDGDPKPRKKPRAESTINRYLDAVSAVFTYAQAHRPRLVDEKLKFAKFEEIAGRLHWLEIEQEAVVVQWLIEHGHAIHATCVRFLIATGLRRGEFEKIAPEQIRHDHVILYADQTKGKAYREAFLHPDLAREMRAIIATGHRPRAYLLARTFKKAAVAVGYSSELCIHSLRHTCASRMIDRGVDIRDVQVVLGHKLITTTQRYAHIRRDRLREGAQKVAGTAWDFEASGAQTPGSPKLKAI